MQKNLVIDKEFDHTMFVIENLNSAIACSKCEDMRRIWRNKLQFFLRKKGVKDENLKMAARNDAFLRDDDTSIVFFDCYRGLKK